MDMPEFVRIPASSGLFIAVTVNHKVTRILGYGAEGSMDYIEGQVKTEDAEAVARRYPAHRIEDCAGNRILRG